MSWSKTKKSYIESQKCHKIEDFVDTEDLIQ